MQTRSFVSWSIRLLATVLLLAGSTWAQFTGNIEGTVSDPSGAAVAQAKVELINVANKVSATTTTDASGSYRFLSLAPGSYKITVEAAGFGKAESTVTLETNQNLNVPISVKVGTATDVVTVTSEAPLVNTAETRNQLTLETQELSTLPLAGRNMFSLVTLAPGVSGLGVTGSAVGSGLDNFSTETTIEASANGQGGVANMWVIDGLDVTSSVRQGVSNLTPNPDFVQEASTQVNTFSAEYGHSSSIQLAMTTKSGADQFHGLASDYFNYQKMFAKLSLPASAQTYAPFHSNNMSAAIGGPIIPHHQFYFFFGVEPLRSSASTGAASRTVVDPAFVAFTQANHPNTFGTKILTTYLPKNVVVGSVLDTALEHFGKDKNGANICGTPAVENIPCSTAMTDNATFNATNFRNGTQYFVRVDKYFKNDRIYGSFFRTLLNFGGPAIIPQFGTTNQNWQRALQVNWTHTFGPTTLNEAVFAQNRIEGKLAETGDFTIPNISVNRSLGYGVGFAQGDFIQHNYHWRDVLTHVRGAHVLKVGYEGWFGDDVEPFQGPWSHPNFGFDNLLRLAQDAPTSEGGVMYNPVTGQQQLWDWNAASKTWGIFAQDTWKARRNLTVSLGFRFDNQGNPYSRAETTVFGNFYLGTGSTFQDQVTSGIAKPTKNALLHSPKTYNPRIGASWDINGKGDWVVRGGFGMYSNWLTPANIQEEFRGNPPGLILPGFNSTNADPNLRPIFAQGTGSTPPFGFTFPGPICPTPPCIDAKGGIPGANPTIGGINPNIVSPTAYIFAAALEHRLGSRLVASVLYSGSHGSNLVGGGNTITNVSYGSDINLLPGNLIGTPVNTVPTRPNSSFGTINYTDNDRVSNYQGVTLDLRGRFQRAFFDGSYTHSSSKDDASIYPTALNPHQFYGPSPWDVPNRFSLLFNYQLPGLNNGLGAVGKFTGGWGLSGQSIYQTGNPFTVFTNANFWNGGDYNADGNNFDFPNASSYSMSNSRSAYLTGAIAASQFTAPTAGTEGNEKTGQFRQPSFFQSNVTIYKDTHITERLNFQFRFEFYNVFNHVSFNNIQNNLNSGNFGHVQGEYLPRWWQIGGKITF